MKRGELSSYKFPLQHDIIENLINSFNKHQKTQAKYRLAFLTEKYTGLRVSDVVTLRWSEINEDSIHKQMKKTKKFITIPLHPELKREIQYYKEMFGRVSEYVFPTLSNYSKRPHIAPASMRYEILKFRRASGYDESYQVLNQKNGNKPLKRLCNHALRHDFAQNVYIKSGYDIYLVKELLGHKDIKTTQRYLDTTIQRKAEVINML